MNVYTTLLSHIHGLESLHYAFIHLYMPLSYGLVSLYVMFIWLRLKKTCFRNLCFQTLKNGSMHVHPFLIKPKVARTMTMVHELSSLRRFSQIIPSIWNLLASSKAGRKGVLFGADLAKKLNKATMCPVSYCTSFSVLKLLNSRIMQHFSRLASMPLLVSKNLRNFPPRTPNTHWVQVYVELPYLSEDLSQVFAIVSVVDCFGYHIIYIYFHSLSNLLSKNQVHESLVRGCIFKPKASRYNSKSNFPL